MRSIAIGFCALALFAPLAGAQQSLQSSTPAPAVVSSAPVEAVARAAPAAPAGPRIEAAAVGVRPATSSNESVQDAPIFRRGQGQDVALMAVGVGAMIVGAIVSGTAGTVILIGGAAMALFGLYNYLE